MDIITIKKRLSKRLLYFFVAGLICSSFGYANGAVNSELIAENQQARVTVTGRVVDFNGEPLVGVSVAVTGTTIGTLTGNNGAYSVSVQPGSTLTFQYVGYTTLTRVVDAQTTIDVTMQEDFTTIDQIVVVGYGSQKLENLTGAVTSVNVQKTLASRPIADVGRGLQGSVPGLSVVVRSGEVGSDPSMKIRGVVGSISGNSNPLILVDNVEIPSIQIVNPSDIESISVLKDAASTSIYGSKAAFGVILITTKKGAATDRVDVNYSGNFSWQDRAKPLEMAGIEGLEYAYYAHQTRDPNNKNTTPYGNFIRYNEESIAKSKEWVKKYGDTGLVKPTDPYVYGRDYYIDPVTGSKLGIRTFDAVEALVANWTPTMTHNLSVNGRSGKMGYSVGLGLLDQSGMTKYVKHDDFKRYNASVKVSSEINKYLTVRAGAIYTDRIKRYPSTNSTTADPWLYAYRWSSLLPIGVTDQWGDPLRNPAYELANSTTSQMRDIYTNVNLGATVNFTRNWNLEFDYVYTTREDIRDTSYPRFHYKDPWYNPAPKLDENGNPIFVDEEGNVTTEGGMQLMEYPWIYNPSVPTITDGTPALDNGARVGRESTRYNSHTLNLYTTYNLKIKENHTFKFMLGMNQVANDYRGHTARLGGLYNFENPQFNFTSGGQHTASGTAGWDAQLGFFGRVNYNYKEKYLFEANLRYDGTSKFPKEMWWAAFPSFSAGWVMSHENFFQPLTNVVNFAKIRASWGSVGDQSVSNNLYLRTMTRRQISWLDTSGLGMYTNDTPNAAQSEVKWQRIENLDIGLDLQFLQGRLAFSFDWFQRYTKDMIMAGDALPHTYGASAPQGNYGNLRTRGWEMSLNFNHRFKNGLGISMLATLWDTKTMITKGPDHMTPWEDRKIDNTWVTGKQYGDIYGYVTDRLYQKEDFVYDNDGNMRKTTIIIDGTGRESYMLSGDNPVYQSYLESAGGVVIFRPGDVKFVDLDGDGYITPGEATFGDPGDRKVIGNSSPRYEYGFRLGLDYKGFDLQVFLQGVGKRKMWGDGQLSVPGYNLGDGAMAKAFTEDYWREDNTGAFYPRPWDMQIAAGATPTSYSMQIQSRYMLNMAYMRIKNITVGYSFPARWLKKILLSKARLYVSLENFFTFDKLRGLPVDPESVKGYSMFNTTNYNSGRIGVGTPMFKSASVGIELGF